MQERMSFSAARPPDEPFTGEELHTAVRQATIRVINPRMREAGLSRWTDDVAGEVALSAWKARASFDPELGQLQGWINRIAQRRVADRIAAESTRNGDLLAESSDSDSLSVEEQLARAAEQANRGESTDVAATVAEKLAIEAWLGPVMAATSGVMEPVAFMHAFVLYTRFDCDVKAASEAFGVPAGRVREHKRSLELHAQVILRAWQKSKTLPAQGPRLSDLIECLPEPGIAGAWTRRMAEALLSWRGKLSDVPVEHVMEATGWTFDTARQYLAITKRLLQVALGVMQAQQFELPE